MEDSLQRVIDYLVSQGPKTKTEIASGLDIKKNTLTGYLKVLEERGFIKTGGKGVPVEVLVADKYPELKTKDAVQWIVLFLLKDSSMSIADIKKQYMLLKEGTLPDEDQQGEVLPSLYNYLQKLIEQGYVEKEEKTVMQKDGSGKKVDYYRATPLAPSIVRISYDDLIDLFLAHNVYSISEASNSLADKIQWILDIDDNEIAQQQVYGKLNQFRKKSLDQLERLFSTAYRSNKIRLTYTSKSGKQIEILFSVGSLIYSAEANEFYLIGEQEEYSQITIIKLSSVNSIVSADEKNEIFNSEKYQKLTKSMISVEGGEPFDVKIRFLNKPWIREKLEGFITQRENGHLDLTYNRNKEILYSEKGVIGLRGLHRFVRTFGPNAIVVEPKQLIDLMLDTSRRMEERYSEGDTI